MAGETGLDKAKKGNGLVSFKTYGKCKYKDNSILRILLSTSDFKLEVADCGVVVSTVELLPYM